MVASSCVLGDDASSNRRIVRKSDHTQCMSSRRELFRVFSVATEIEIAFCTLHTQSSLPRALFRLPTRLLGRKIKKLADFAPFEKSFVDNLS